MADEIHHPHDLMVHTVLRDLAAATNFLQAHLTEEVSQALHWSTLKLLEGSFVDEDLHGSEADFLYEIEHVSGEESVWVYVLLEHQSTPDRWTRCHRFRPVAVSTLRADIRVIYPLDAGAGSGAVVS